MKTISFIGYVSQDTKEELVSTFSDYGFNLVFNQERKHAFKIKLVNFISRGGKSAAGENPVIGFAALNEDVAYVAYPVASTLNCNCTKSSLFTNSDRLFALTCVHEVLHLIGLNHCRNLQCIMAKTKCRTKKSNYCLPCLSTRRQKIDLCKTC